MGQEILIDVELDRKKPVVVEVNGVKGQGCQALTNALIADLGAAQDSTLKSEFYEDPIKTDVRQRENEASGF